MVIIVSRSILIIQMFDHASYNWEGGGPQIHKRVHIYMKIGTRGPFSHWIPNILTGPENTKT